MGRRSLLLAGVLTLVLGLAPGLPGSPAGAVTLADGSLTFHLNGTTSVGIDPTINGDFEASSYGEGVLTSGPKVQVLSCGAYEEGFGSLVSSEEVLQVDCSGTDLTLTCVLRAPRSYLTVKEVYGRCELHRGSETFYPAVTVAALQWVPTFTAPEYTAFIFGGTLPLEVSV
ncbi:MAG: hypothetical protein QOK43_2571 [Acidimicrobiaceae bacterium]|nr:hypothetical protein [Acidimicrobiaceae bacterium]